MIALNKDQKENIDPKEIQEQLQPRCLQITHLLDNHGLKNLYWGHQHNFENI